MDYFYRDVDRVRILELSGALDQYNSQPLRQWLEVVTVNDPAYVVINMAGVEFLNSSALAILVHGIKQARQHKGDLRLCCLRNPIRMLFELTRLDNVFEIFVSEEDAIQSFRIVENISSPVQKT